MKVRLRRLTELRDKLVSEIRAIKEVVSSEAYTALKVVKEEHSLPVTQQPISDALGDLKGRHMS